MGNTLGTDSLGESPPSQRRCSWHQDASGSSWALRWFSVVTWFLFSLVDFAYIHESDKSSIDFNDVAIIVCTVSDVKAALVWGDAQTFGRLGFCTAETSSLGLDLWSWTVNRFWSPVPLWQNRFVLPKKPEENLKSAGSVYRLWLYLIVIISRRRATRSVAMATVKKKKQEL